MPTETTASTEAPAQTTTTSTEAPAASVAAQTEVASPGATTATVAPVELKGQSKAANKADLLAKLAAKAKDVPAKTQTAATAEVEVATDGAAATETQAAVSTEAPAPAARVQTDEDREAARLNEIAQRSRAVAAREAKWRAEQAQREADWKKREAAVTAERERIAKLDAARAKNSPLAALRAAGYTDEQIMGASSTLPIDLLNEIQQEAEGKPAPEPLTAEKARAIIAEERRLEREAAEKEASDRQAAQLEQQRNAYFAGVEKAFAAGEFQRVAAVKPSMGELDAYFHEHGKKTGVWLSPPQLLEAFEKRYEASGITVAVKPKPGAKPAPAPKPPKSTTSTISARATSDAGDLVPAAQKKNRTIAEIHAEGRAKALAAIEQRRAASGR